MEWFAHRVTKRRSARTLQQSKIARSSAAQLVDFGLERCELGLQLLHVAAARPGFSLGLAAKDLGGTLEHRHVALGEIGEDVAAESVLDRALVALERVHRGFQIL